MLLRSTCGRKGPPWLRAVAEARVVSTPMVSALVLPLAGLGDKRVVITGPAILFAPLTATRRSRRPALDRTPTAGGRRNAQTRCRRQASGRDQHASILAEIDAGQRRAIDDRHPGEPRGATGAEQCRSPKQHRINPLGKGRGGGG